MPEEKYKRLATTHGIKRPWTPHERYMLFARGFRDGAGTKAMRKDHEGLGAYDRGYAAGQAAAHAAVAAYAKEIGYEPTILRAAADSEGETP